MPTGYTAELYEGRDVTFRGYLLRCARAFGALVEMRDEPMDAPIPEKLTADNYHADALAKAQADLARLETMTATEAEDAAGRAYEVDMAYWRKRVSEAIALRSRYETVLAEARAWVPPTPDHQELKRFMVSQLEESISWDCHEPAEPTRLTGAEWLEKALETCRSGIEYRAEKAETATQRAAERTAWVRALLASVPRDVVPVR